MGFQLPIPQLVFWPGIWLPWTVSPTQKLIIFKTAKNIGMSPHHQKAPSKTSNHLDLQASRTEGFGFYTRTHTDTYTSYSDVLRNFCYKITRVFNNMSIYIYILYSFYLGGSHVITHGHPTGSSVENQVRGFNKCLTGIQEGSKEKCKDPL